MPKKKEVVLTDEQKKLVEENHNLIYWFIRKYNLSVDEWYGDLACELCLSAVTYDKNKGMFSTYAHYRMWNVMTKTLSRKNATAKRIPEYLIDSYESTFRVEGTGDEIPMIETITNGFDYADHIVNKIYLKNVLNSIPVDIKKAIILYYSGYTQDEIGDLLGVSQVTVSRWISNPLRGEKTEQWVY